MAWRVARSLTTLFTQFNDAFPNRNKVADGTIGDAEHSARESDHNPDDDGVVRAGDFTNDPTGGLVSNDQAIALAESRDSRIKYIISNGRIWDPVRGWRPYTGGPNPHIHHFHLSVVADNRADDPRPWQILLPDFSDEDDEMKPHRVIVVDVTPGAYCLADGTVIDQLTEEDLKAFSAVYESGRANQRQVDIVQSKVRSARA